jgi:hypothetical protein
MTYQIHGYFEHPEKSKSRELSRFTYAYDIEDIGEAHEVARNWVATERYPYVFIYEMKTKRTTEMKAS